MKRDACPSSAPSRMSRAGAWVGGPFLEHGWGWPAAWHLEACGCRTTVIAFRMVNFPDKDP
jgi:hypothetical protein